MPLHVNLYHEIQRQELDRKRDPLRLGMMGLAVIAVGFVAFYFVALEQSHEVGVKFGALQDQFSKLDPKAKAAKARQDELNQEIAASETMTKAVDDRFFWAPVLDQILQAVPKTVQLTHLTAQVNEAATPGYTVTITGIASAMEPRKEAEALRMALTARLNTQCNGATSMFKSLEDSEEFVMLDGHRLSTANFTIQVELPMKDAGAPAPAVPARKPKLVAAE